MTNKEELPVVVFLALLLYPYLRGISCVLLVQNLNLIIRCRLLATHVAVLPDEGGGGKSTGDVEINTFCGRLLL